MDVKDDQYGFDAMFMTEVPEHLKCVICGLVLRNPVQILKCGHKFCELCFNRLKCYSVNLDTELLCPIDRESVDVNSVIADKGMESMVGNLKVQCSHSEVGCVWQGDLRDLKLHEDKCEYREQKIIVVERESSRSSNGSVEISVLLRELHKKVGKCEDDLLPKKEDLLFLTNDFCVMSADIDLLNSKNKNIEDELKATKKRNQDLKMFEAEMKEKHVVLEQKVDTLEKQLLLTNRELEEKEIIIRAIKGEIEEIKSSEKEDLKELLTKSELKISDVIQLQNSLETSLKQQGDKILELSSQGKDKIEEIKCSEKEKDLKELLTKLELKISDDIKQLQNSFEESLRQQSDRTLELTFQADLCEKETLDKCNKSNDGVDRNLLRQSQKRIEDHEDHVTNIENIIFSDVPGTSSDIVLHWKLQNYQYHFDIGEDVHSPLFFTKLRGYCFQLGVSWSGIRKEQLGIWFMIHRAKAFTKELEQFNVPFTLELHGKNGKVVSWSITLDVIEKHRRNCFTISPGRDSALESCGEIWNCHEIHNYVVNDMLHIVCRLTPP